MLWVVVNSLENTILFYIYFKSILMQSHLFLYYFILSDLYFMFVSRCSHMWCRSRRFDCIPLVFFGRWGRLVMRDLVKHDALLWLVVFQQLWSVHFDPCCFIQWFAPSAVRCHTALLLLCFLIVGIHASGISIPQSLLMLSGWSLIWIASLTLHCSNKGHDQ